MKSTEQMKNEMAKRLQNLEARRHRLESYAESIDKKLGAVRQEIGRLAKAIAALNGLPPVDMGFIPRDLTAPGAYLPAREEKELSIKQTDFDPFALKNYTKFDSDLIPDTPIQAHPTNPRKGMLDGVEIDIPEGMHIGKNSFGEDALIFNGVELPPMTEPIVPANKAVTTEVLEEFDDPKNLY